MNSILRFGKNTVVNELQNDQNSTMLNFLSYVFLCILKKKKFGSIGRETY